MTSEQEAPKTSAAKLAIRIRAGHRGYVTKVLAQVDDILAAVNFDSEKLLMLKNTLQIKAQTLNDLDAQILNTLQDADIDNEICETADLQSVITLRILKINTALDKAATNQRNAHPAAQASRTPDRPIVKMPKLEIAKFSGDPKDYARFRDSFNAAVGHSSLSPIQKFTYLKGFLRGDAEKSIKGLPLTEANYNNALEVLQQRFGNRQVIVNSHMDALLKLPCVMAEDDTKGLRDVYDQTQAHVRSLQSLNITSEMYGTLLVPILISKLPPALNLLISRKFDSSSDTWKFDEVLNALKQELEARERCSVKPNAATANFLQQPETTDALLSTAIASKPPCPFCTGEHFADACKKVADNVARKRILQQQGRCFKCLRTGHVARTCTSMKKCFKCKRGHHTAICDASETRVANAFNEVRNDKQSAHAGKLHSKSDKKATSPAETNGNLTTVSSLSNSSDKVLLETATVIACNPAQIHTTPAKCRVLFDGGCQKTYITEDLRARLKLSTIRKEMIGVNTFGGGVLGPSVHDVVNLSLKSRTGGPHILLEAVVTKTICSQVQLENLQSIAESYDHLSNLQLADSLCELPSDADISILIGLNYYWKILSGKVVRSNNSNSPVALSSVFGYILSGPCSVPSSASLPLDPSKATLTYSFFSRNMLQDSISQTLTRFWELEHLGLEDVTSVEETIASKTYFDGERYAVPLPWREDRPLLPDNYAHARKRYFSLLARLKRNPELLKKYDAVMKEQLQTGVIQQVNENDPGEIGKVYYMPHTCVLREDKSSSKVRVVFDASAKTDGVSLNDCLYSGPSLYTDLFAILVRFRCHRVGLVADLEKAFLNVAVQDHDQNVLRFLWTNNALEENPTLQTFKFKRVCFGVNCSPFLLASVITTHLHSAAKNSPALVHELQNSTYVDNYCGGSTDAALGFQFYNDSKQLFKRAGMNLRQWATNDSQLQRLIDNAEHDPGTTETLLEPSYVDITLNPSLHAPNKVLGLIWDKDADALKIDMTPLLSREFALTKRTLLSVSSSIYDPLGFLSPAIIKLKVIFQNICKEGGTWDEPLSEDLASSFRVWCEESLKAPVFSIPRPYFVTYGRIESIMTIGFSDASENAYAAVVYLRVKKEGHELAEVSLVCSKTRVTPLQPLTTPRAELCGAHILSKLLPRVNATLSTFARIDSEICLTDSAIVFWWIQKVSTQYTRFVQNRLRAIRASSPPECWYHVSGQDNIADLPSRGCHMSELLHRQDWKSGPEWLKLPRDLWPVTRFVGLQGCDVEETVQSKSETSSTLTAAIAAPVFYLDRSIHCENYSDYDKLIRVTAWIQRFLHNIKQRVQIKRAPGLPPPDDPRQLRESMELNAAEYLHAENLWFRHLQNLVQAEPKYCETSKSLGIYMDNEGILRCAGRLRKSNLSIATKFPIILPRTHHVTSLLIFKAHQKVFHNGLKETLAELRSRFWIAKGRQKVKQVIRPCVICKRLEGKPYPHPEQAALPDFRVTGTRVFQTTALDYFGPLYIKCAPARHTTMLKCYVLLLTCATSRMLHLEMTSDLGADTCVAALKRFIARRGIPERLLSDNSSTFRSSQLQRFATKHNIHWQYNLPQAAWWGGLFERLVRSTKRCLRKSLRSARLNYEQMQTVLCEIEAVLNSRPLTYIYDTDFEVPLTPSHLLLGRRYCSLQNNTPSEDPPAEADRDDLVNSVKMQDNILDHFWRRWEREYLINLRETHRQNARHDLPVSVGDVVLLQDENTKRSHWRLAIIQKLLKGDDGKTRGAEIRLSARGKQPTILKRPIQRLFPLEISAPQLFTHPDISNTSERQDLPQESSEAETPVASSQNSDEEGSVCTPKSDAPSDDENIPGDDVSVHDVTPRNPSPMRQRRAAAIDGESRRRLTSMFEY